AATPLGALTISTAGDVTAQAVTASSLIQSAGSGTTLFNGDVTTSGVSGINLTGTAFTFLGNVTTSGGGAITLANAGLLTTSAGEMISSNGGFSQTGVGAVSLGSNVSTNNSALSFAGAITLTANVILNSGTSNGDITVATVDGNFNLTFTAGRDIFAGAIGSVTRVGVLKATTVRNNHASSISAASVIQLAGTGTTFLVGNIDTNTPAGINLVGTNFSRSGSIITTNGGSFTVTNTGSITGTSINTTSIDGSYTQIGVGPLATTSLAGTISARTGISISSPATLISDPSNLTPIILDASGGNGNIVITGTIDNNIQAPHTLILRSGTGSATLSAAVGSISPIGPLLLGNIHDFTAVAISAAFIGNEALASLSGQTTFNGALATSGALGINIAGNTFNFNNSVTTTSSGPVTITNTGALSIPHTSIFSLDGPFNQNGSGPVSFGGSITTTNDAISFASPMILTANGSLNSAAGAGTITLGGSIDGAFTLDLTAGTGDITFLGAVGQIQPPAGMTLFSANNVLISSNAIHSGPFVILSATGTTTVNGALTATSISMTGATINFNNAVTSTSGSIAIANSGVFTVAPMAPILASSSFSQTGAGTISLGANVSTTGTLSFASPITMTQNIVLNSGNGNLILSGTVGGVFDLTLTAGAGDITLAGNVGTPRIGDLTITSTNNITVEAITEESLNLMSATGLATLNGGFDTNGVLGITLVGNNFLSNGTITTTNGGPLTITNSGLVTALSAG